MASLLARRKAAVAVLAISCSILVSACSFSAASPTFAKGAVRAVGAQRLGVFRRRLAGDERFDLVGVDRFAARRQPIPSFCVSLAASAPPMRIERLTAAEASRWLEPWIPTDAEKARGIDEHLFRDQLAFRGDFVQVAFDAGTGGLLWITLNAPPAGASAEGPSIGPLSCEPMHGLPLEHSQLLEVFGQPDWEGYSPAEGDFAPRW